MNIEQIILSTLGIFKIKYSVLDNLKIKKIDALHIDLNTIFKPLFKLKDIDNDESYKYTIASAIINLVAHFRAYFTKHGNDATIYLYYSKNKKMSSSENEIINSLIQLAINIIEIIIKYIPKVYLIPFMDMKQPMSYFINNNKNNYIITKNPILYQFISKDTHIIRPYRDDSYIISKKNLYNKLAQNDVDYTISTELLSAILSFSGVNEFKGIKGLGIKKTLKLFQKSIDNRDILNEYYPNISDLINDIGAFDRYNLSELNSVISTFSQIDIGKFSNKNSSSYVYDLFIVDKFAKKDLKELNVKYFTGFNSLMLQELLMEPKQSTNNKNKIEW